MYVRRVRYEGGGGHYVLRKTYRKGGVWKYLDLADLGPDPAELINSAGSADFYCELEQKLDESGISYDSDELEEVLMPFFHPRIRYAYERSNRRYFPYAFSRSCPRDELSGHQADLHDFDVRRLHYLKFGHMDMGDIEKNRSLKFLKVLSCKCRDEIETTFDAMEEELPASDIRNYIYSAFHIQSYFRSHLLRDYPAGLDSEKVDSFFLHEICRLNESPQFFRGVERGDEKALHPYLAKYVWLYFDNRFEAESRLEAFLQEFMARRNFYRPVAPKPSLTIEDACRALDLSFEIFSAMTKKELIRHYRRRAKNVHPDRGGDHDSFVRMKEAYEVLLAVKS